MTPAASEGGAAKSLFRARTKLMTAHKRKQQERQGERLEDGAQAAALGSPEA
jgi:hypothetical protein